MNACLPGFLFRSICGIVNPWQCLRNDYFLRGISGSLRGDGYRGFHFPTFDPVV
jgi:hypothetical protein